MVERAGGADDLLVGVGSGEAITCLPVVGTGAGGEGEEGDGGGGGG